jgi:hypothetical protein
LAFFSFVFVFGLFRTLSESVPNINVDVLYKQFMGLVRSMQGTATNSSLGLSKKEIDLLHQETAFSENEIIELFHMFKGR